MSRGVNKVILVGNLGNDPDSRTMPGGDMVANFTLATSDSWKDKQTGEQKESTEWHRCVAYRRTAEIIAEYLHKGSQVYIEGKLQTRKWQDKDGNDRYTTEIVVQNMQMLGSKPQASSKVNQGRDTSRGDEPPGSGAPATDDFSDDIPF